LPLQKAGEFKVCCRFHRDRGMTAMLKVRGVNGGSRHGRLSGESTRWRSKM